MSTVRRQPFPRNAARSPANSCEVQTSSNNPFADFSDFTPSERFATPPPDHKKENNNPFRRATSVRARPSTSHHESVFSSQPRRSRTVSSRPRTPQHDYSPLEYARRESKLADRSPHLKKSAIPRPDLIDRLGNVFGDTAVHHDGPYDATLASRQVRGYAPVEAVRESNMLALAATPRANIIDSLERHYPLQGTAMVPPGMEGFGGEVMPDYEEYDVMTRDGNYKRWPDRVYRDEDLKGKGEPTYTIEEFEKQQRASHRIDKRRKSRLDPEEFEMHSGRDRRAASAGRAGTTGISSDLDLAQRDRLSRSESLGGRLKRRIGSLRRKTGAIAL